MADMESEEISSDSDLQLADNKAAGYYDNACNDYQSTEVERTNNLNNMQKIITRLLKKGNVTIGTQTEPVEGLETDLHQLMRPSDPTSEGEQDLNPATNDMATHEASQALQKAMTGPAGAPTSGSQRLTKPLPGSVHLYGRVNAELQPDNEKLGELHMRLNMLL